MVTNKGTAERIIHSRMKRALCLIYVVFHLQPLFWVKGHSCDVLQRFGTSHLTKSLYDIFNKMHTVEIQNYVKSFTHFGFSIT